MDLLVWAPALFLFCVFVPALVAISTSYAPVRKPAPVLPPIRDLSRESDTANRAQRIIEARAWARWADRHGMTTSAKMWRVYADDLALIQMQRGRR